MEEEVDRDGETREKFRERRERREEAAEEEKETRRGEEDVKGWSGRRK